MKNMDKFQQSSGSRAWHNPQALLHTVKMQERVKQPRGIAFHRGWLDSKQVVENGELAVSLMQTAKLGIGQIQEQLQEIEGKLLHELSGIDRKAIPDPALQVKITQVLKQMDTLIQETTFKGQCLLDGQFGITGKGQCSKILGGVPVGRATRKEPIRVEVSRMATRSRLSGHQKLTEATLRQEAEITLSENDHLVKYEIAADETVESLLKGLQTLVMRKGLDLEIQLDAQGYLQIQHCQYGSPFVFSGRSQKTALVSKRPNVWQFCQLGQNCVAKINAEDVPTRGHLLLCEKPVQGVAGLAIFWEGPKPGVDELTLENRAVSVSGGGVLPQSNLWIAVEACTPEILAHGVQNKSGFNALSDVIPTTWQSVSDTLYLVQLSLLELEDRIRLLETMQHQFEHMALSALELSQQSTPEQFGERTPSEQVTAMAAILQEAFSP